MTKMRKGEDKGVEGKMTGWKTNGMYEKDEEEET